MANDQHTASPLTRRIRADQALEPTTVLVDREVVEYFKRLHEHEWKARMEAALREAVPDTSPS